MATLTMRLGRDGHGVRSVFVALLSMSVLSLSCVAGETTVTKTRTETTTTDGGGGGNGGSGGSGGGGANTFAMPDLVGMNLQDAQDLLQTFGSYILDQEDATGLGRLQIIDSNWTVCRQSPSPGSSVAVSRLVTLWSAPLDEGCP